MTIIEEIAKFLSCKTDTVVTILVTISIFLAGLLTNALISRIKKSGERKSYRKYFYSLIENIRDYSCRYAPSLKESIDNLIIENQPLFIIKRRTENSFQTFDKIQFEKIYEAFFSGIICKKKLRRKAFNFILNYTTLIKFYYDAFPNDIEKLHATFQRFENEWNTNIDNIRNVYEVLRQQYFSNTLNPIYFDFFKEFDSIIQVWFSKEDRTNRLILKTFIIDKLDTQFFKKYKELEIAPRLEIHSADALLAFSNMLHTLDNYKRHFGNYYWLIKQCDRKMAVAQKILTKTNLNR
jgi:hypothetical protein